MMIGAYTPVCQEDERWVDQYLAEVERVGAVFAVLFDKCEEPLKKRMRTHPACVTWIAINDPKSIHHESNRGLLLPRLQAAGVTLAVLWDIDETWETHAPGKLRDLDAYRGFDSANVHWLNLWGENGYSVRLDNPSNPYRTKLHRLDRGVEWQWRGAITVDPYPRDDRKVYTFPSDLVCLHHGLKTRELRLQHKERWDRVYGGLIGKNPYDYWDYLLDEVNHPPVLGDNVYG